MPGAIENAGESYEAVTPMALASEPIEDVVYDQDRTGMDRDDIIFSRHELVEIARILGDMFRNINRGAAEQRRLQDEWDVEPKGCRRAKRLFFQDIRRFSKTIVRQSNHNEPVQQNTILRGLTLFQIGCFADDYVGKPTPLRIRWITELNLWDCALKRDWEKTTGRRLLAEMGERRARLLYWTNVVNISQMVWNSFFLELLEAYMGNDTGCKDEDKVDRVASKFSV